MTITTPTLTERAQAARAEADQLDARALALNAQVDAESRARTERQRPVVEAAMSAAARAALAAVDRPAKELRPWADTVADVTIDLNGLWLAWLDHRGRHASRAAVVTAAGNTIDAIDPTFDDDGRLIPARRDTHDRMNSLEFLPEVEAAVRTRTAAAAAAAAQTVALSVQDAGNAAAARIK
jgi:hypothetical protein